MDLQHEEDLEGNACPCPMWYQLEQLKGGGLEPPEDTLAPMASGWCRLLAGTVAFHMEVWRLPHNTWLGSRVSMVGNRASKELHVLLLPDLRSQAIALWCILSPRCKSLRPAHTQGRGIQTHLLMGRGGSENFNSPVWNRHISVITIL